MDAAIVTSGTATLETALHDVPMVIVYRTSLPTYLAAKAVVHVPSIGMVNIIAGERIVPELIQQQASPARIAGEVVGMLRSSPERQIQLRQRLRAIRERLGPAGAIERAARAVLEELKN